jgi:hypothetical protein
LGTRRKGARCFRLACHHFLPGILSKPACRNALRTDSHGPQARPEGNGQKARRHSPKGAKLGAPDSTAHGGATSPLEGRFGCCAADSDVLRSQDRSMRPGRRNRSSHVCIPSGCGRPLHPSAWIRLQIIFPSKSLRFVAFFDKCDNRSRTEMTPPNLIRVPRKRDPGQRDFPPRPRTALPSRDCYTHAPRHLCGIAAARTHEPHHLTPHAASRRVTPSPVRFAAIATPSPQVSQSPVRFAASQLQGSRSPSPPGRPHGPSGQFNRSDQ